MCVPGWGAHITRGTCSRVGEHILLGICVPQAGEHILLGICVCQVGKVFYKKKYAGHDKNNFFFSFYFTIFLWSIFFCFFPIIYRREKPQSS